jgi:thiosulfate dehydrogenase [quinone] large subunit
MFGPSVERDFPHIAYEQDQLRRKFELQRLFDANQPQVQRPRRSIADIFGRLTPRCTLRSSDRRAPVSLSAFVGFIMLFSALMAGYTFVSAGHEKWGDPAWTGNSAGIAIDGFLKGADAKSIESATNPHPEVSPIAREFNERVFSQHTRLFSWLTVGGELLLPIAVLGLIVVRFRRSRVLLIGVAMLAASLNFLYLTEGDSSANPPMVFMWLTIIWLAVLWPTAALFYAVDLHAPVDPAPARSVDSVDSMEAGVGLWFFLVAVLAIIVAGSLQLYWNDLQTFAALAIGSVALSAALTQIKRRRALAAPHDAAGSMTTEASPA